MIVALLAVGAYFLGAIPIGVLIARSKGIDLTKVGSGNVGATNVNRALGKEWGIAVFVMDMLKGLIPGLAARYLIPQPLGPLDAQTIWLMVGFCAVIGHARSPFLKFRGGKGVSTALGAGVAAAPLVSLSAFALFIVILATTRYMAIASIIGVSVTMLFSLIYPGQSLQMVPLFFLVSLLIVVLHRPNIERLRAGTEPKFSFVRRREADS